MKKHYNIELLRFGFSLIIVYFHILHSNIIPFTGEHGTYLDLQYMCRMAYTLVDAFLIISGYFLYTSWCRSPEKSFIEFSLHRFFRIWPVFAFYMVCFTAMNGGSTEHILLDLALLRCTGLSLTHTEIIWYVAPFFWCSLLMYAILKLCRKGVAALIFALIAYWGYLINLNYTNGGTGAEVFGNILSLAMLRVAGGLSIGILIAMALEALAAEYKLDLLPRRYVHTILFSLIEAVCGILLLLIILVRRPYINNIFSVVVIFCVLFICFINNLGIFSRIFDRPVFAKFGKYSYAIYVMQQVSFDIMSKTFWLKSSFIRDHELLTLLLSVAFSGFVGIAVYYLVENPVYSAFRKLEKKHRITGIITK